MRPETQKKREFNFIYQHLINKLIGNTIFSQKETSNIYTTKQNIKQNKMIQLENTFIIEKILLCIVKPSLFLKELWNTGFVS